MRVFCTLIGLTTLLVVPHTAVPSSRSQEKEKGQDSTSAGTEAKDAKAFEEGLKANPDNLTAREWLIRYYFKLRLESKASGAEEMREQHVLWLIEHYPESEIAGSPEAIIEPYTTSGKNDVYQRGRQLWMEQVSKHPDNPTILRNAAQYVSLTEGATARELLEKALELDPKDMQTSFLLGHSYELERIRAKSPAEKTMLAQKALAVREQAMAQADKDERFSMLADAAKSAFEAGETEKAEQYASELVQEAKEFKDNWNYGNAVLLGNIVLGRIALRQGDLASAKEHLLAAGESPGSPQLDSFGPNMTLAKELLEKGERDAVLKYFQLCGKFWEMGGDQLREWTATVKGGGIPNFGPNLNY